MPTHYLKLFPFILICLTSFSAFADVYEYIDEAGVSHLSDSPTDERYVMIFQSEVIATASDEITTAASLQPRLPANFTTSQLFAQIEQSARNNQLDSELIHAVIHVESDFKPQATSHKGAQGLMQLMPATASRLGVNNSYDPVQNIEGGARYLRELLNLFHNDTTLAIAAYNAGENAVIRSGYRIPPYKETQAYVPKVLSIYRALLKQRTQKREM